MEIPDFEDLVKKAEEIQSLSKRKNLLAFTIDKMEAKIVLEAVFDPKWAVNNKTPSMDFIKSTWMQTGFFDEMLPMREEFATLSADLEKARTDLELLRMQVDIWRTESATNRMTTL